MFGKTVTDYAFSVRTTRWRRRLRKLFPKMGVLLLAVTVSYLVQFWWRHAHVTQWAQQAWKRTTKQVLKSENAYTLAFDRCFRALRADRRVRMIRYEFPVAALNYQQATAGGWRLQSHRAILAGIAVPRAFRGVLDDHGILFIDPRTTPEASLANEKTPLPLAVLQRDFLLVPDLSGSRRGAYQILPWRQISMKR